MAMVDNVALMVTVAVASVMLIMFLYLQRLLRSSIMEMWESESLELPYVYAGGLVLAAIVFSFFSLRIIDSPLIVSVNITGLLAPVVVSVSILLLRKVKALAALASVAMVAIAAFLVTSVSSDSIFIEFPRWLAPVAVATVCGHFTAKDKEPVSRWALAYVAGSMGVLIGGDLAKIPEFVGKGGDYLVLGGGGLLDFVFLIGIFSIAALWAAEGAAAYIRRRIPARSDMAG